MTDHGTDTAFLDGDGATAALIARHDWSDSLGPPGQWPQSLKTTVGLMLHSPVPLVLLWGEDGIMIYNDAYSVFAGGRHPKLLGSKVLEGWPEAADLNALVMKTGLAGDTLSYKDRELALNRRGVLEPCWVDLDYSPVIDESGKPGGVIAVVVETTERVLAERVAAAEREALRESEQRLQMALSAGNGVGTWDWDVASDRVVADPRFALLYGVDPQKAREGAPIAEFFANIHPDDVPEVQSRVAEAIRTGETFSEEYRLVQPDGSVRWVIAQGRCTLAEDGTPLRFPGVSFDISIRKKAEEKLRVLNTDLERQVIERSSERGTTWQLSPFMFSVLDLRTARFTRVNPAWPATLGWSEDELMAKPFYDFLHPDDVEASREAWKAVRRGEAVLNFENRYRTKSGETRILSWVAVPENGLLYSTTRDVTKEKQAARELEMAQDALRQAQKMEAVGQLTGGIAHDFNNLLQGITGALDRVQHRISTGRPAEAERFLKAASESANRAAALTHRLLAFSRRQTLDPKSLDANRLIAGMEDLIIRTMGPTVSVEVVGAAGVWPIRVDASQLENSLLNLCINARDAMPEGGRLTIETANKWMDDRAARERDIPPGQYVSLCVTDTGTGMAPDVAARAFDPFYTTKPLGSGTGLGLSMIYGFVRQSGGQVRIYSEIGKGTTMCLYFPRHLGAIEEEDEAQSELVERGFGETVLVVDDEPTVRMLIAEVLNEGYYNILEAADGPSALKILETPVRIDLLITDVGLPGGMNGRQVADAARELRKELKVLFITGYAENAAVGNGHLERGMQILAKPFAMSTLANKVREMIES